MRLPITLILIFCVSVTFAQNHNGSTKIDEKERQRLENQFKALKTFYIDDDGVVVYQVSKSNTENQSEETPKETINIVPATQKTASDSNLKKDESVDDGSANPRYMNNYSSKSDSDRNGDAIKDSESTKSEKPTNPVFVEKTAIESKNSYSVMDVTKEILPDKETSKQETTRIQKLLTPSQRKEKKDTDTVEESGVDEKNRDSKVVDKKSVFDKRPSKYKSLEEAALAAEALLESLKKEQGYSANAGSMSSRLSGGASKASFRNKTSGDVQPPVYKQSIVNSDSEKKTETESTTSFGNEPTYYINGKQVDKAEVDKLRKKDIVNREIRVKNTISENPNGEIWYEVSEMPED